MQESSWREQERLMEQLACTKFDKEKVEAELHDAQKQISRQKSMLSDKDRQFQYLEKKLDRQVETASNIKQQLNKERANKRVFSTKSEV